MGPHHICVVFFYGVLQQCGRAPRAPLVPAAVQLDVGAAASVAREPTVCGGGQRRRKHINVSEGFAEIISLWHIFGSELYELHCRLIRLYSITSLPKC